MTTKSRADCKLSRLAPALLLVIGLFQTGLGCGADKAPLKQPAPRSVHVSLVELAAQSSAWSSVSELDKAAQAALTEPPTIAMPVLTAAAGTTNASSGSDEQSRPDSRGIRSIAQKTQSALVQAQARALGHIRERLVRESSELTRRFAAAQETQVAAGVEQARQQAIAQYNASLQSLLTPIAARRINLNVQITALTINARPSNPPTAPDGYWAEMLAKRKAALAKLPLPQTIAQRAALDQISAQVATAKAALQQAANAQVTAYSSTLAENNRQVLARQSIGFFHEQSDLLTVANQIDEQLDAPVSGSISSTNLSAKTAASGVLAAASKRDSGLFPAQAVQKSAARSDAAYFRAQRSRLVAQLLDATRRSAAHAAAQLNYDVVDWNAVNPDPAAVARIGARMRANTAAGA